jgi:hypothetical protein
VRVCADVCGCDACVGVKVCVVVCLAVYVAVCVFASVVVRVVVGVLVCVIVCTRAGESKHKRKGAIEEGLCVRGRKPKGPVGACVWSFFSSVLVFERTREPTHTRDREDLREEHTGGERKDVGWCVGRCERGGVVREAASA